MDHEYIDFFCWLPGVLVQDYKINISSLTEKLPYSEICGTKVGPSYKNGVTLIGHVFGHVESSQGNK